MPIKKISIKESGNLIAKQKGKPIVVVLYRSFCPRCQRFFPPFLKLASQWRDKGVSFHVLSIDTDMNKLKSFLTGKNIPFDALVLSDFKNAPFEKYWGRLGINVGSRIALPFILVMDQNGKVIVNGDMNLERIKKAVDSLIKSPPAVKTAETDKNDTANQSGMINIETADLVGIRLGMNPDEAEQALKHFDGDFITKRFYVGSPKIRYPNVENELFHESFSPGILFALQAVKLTESDRDEVLVYFMPVENQSQNQEKAVSVIRWKTYFKDLPKIEALPMVMQKKMGLPPNNQEQHRNTYFYIWQFNPDGSMITRPSSGSISGDVRFQPAMKPIEPKPRTSQDEIPGGSAVVGLYGYATGLAGGMATYGLSRGGMGTENESVLYSMPSEISTEYLNCIQLRVGVDENPLLASGFSALLIDYVQLITAYNTADQILETMIDNLNSEKAKNARQDEKM